MSRRTFVRAGLVGAAALGVSRALGDDGGLAVRVGQARCEAVWVDGLPDQAVVARMLDAAANALASVTLAGLLATLVTPDDTVGIKVNTLAGMEMSTNLEVALAIAEALQAAGVPAERVVIWDRFHDHLDRALYPINTDGPGVRCYGGEGHTGLDDDAFYASDLGDGKPSHFVRVASRDVTKIINVPIPKDHNCAGVTGCLKNLAFGSVNNTVRFHGAPWWCDPMTAEICAHPVLRDKVVLHVMDALRGLYDGGPIVSHPEALFDHNEIWLSADPVALDTLVLELLNGKRAEAGLPLIGDEGASPKHLRTAEALGLGRPAEGEEIAHVTLD